MLMAIEKQVLNNLEDDNMIINKVNEKSKKIFVLVNYGFLLNL